ncbi:MAG: Rho termination factor N-terminal domain-containing protein, partial [Desulfocucumaceae bacterium]
MIYTDLENKTMQELYKIARDMELSGYSRLRKKELIFEITKKQTEKTGVIMASGVLDIIHEGYGFLRPFKYLPSYDDIYVSVSQIRRFDLRTGDLVEGQVRGPKDNERYYALLRVEKVNGV